jgi:hypothetical protein
MTDTPPTTTLTDAVDGGRTTVAEPLDLTLL